MARLHRVLAIALVSSFAFTFPTACGLFQVKVGGKTYNSSTADSELRSIARDVDSARRKLPTQYGPDPEGELKKIKAAEKGLAKARGRMNGMLKMGTTYDRVKTQMNLLAHDIELAKLQQACSSARAVILDQNEVGELATEADLNALDAAVAALTAELGEGDEGAAWWQNEVVRLVREQPKVAERAEQLRLEAQRKAEEEAAREAARKAKEARKALEQKIRAVRTAALDMMRELDEHMKGNEAPIGEARLASFRDAYRRVAEIHEPDKGLYETRLGLYRLYDAWFAEDAPAAVAAVLGGELTAGGGTKGDKMAIKFKAQAGWCYTLNVRWRTATGGERISDFGWSAKGGNSALQRYTVRQERTPWPNTFGTCVTKKTTVTAHAGLTFAGTRNGLDYAVVGWPKDGFPLHQALYMTVWRGDSCDPVRWASMWTNPIPGSIVYYGKEPHLITSTSRAGQLWLTLMDVSGSDNTRARKTEISSQPPSAVAFRTQFRMPRCPGSAYAEGKQSVKLAKCNESLDAKYERLYEAAENARDNARTLGAYRAAEARLDRLEDQEVAEYERRCVPIEEKIEKALRKTFDGVVDRYTDAPYSDHLDTAKRLAEEEQAL